MLFYTPDISSNHYTLSEEESKHAIRVLRLKIGNYIELIDGKGNWYKAIIENDNVKKCTVLITESKTNVDKRNWNLHIAIAPTKNMERLEWFVEKATEINIDEISFINCNNSERTIVKTERLTKVAVSAMKQSKKAYLPAIHEVVDFKKFIEAKKNFSGQKVIAHCRTEESKTLDHLKTVYKKLSNVLVLIGPEGDFTKEEIDLAITDGFTAINLGDSRLRTETAALYACTAINILNQL